MWRDMEDYQISEFTWVSIKICVYAEVARMTYACVIYTCGDERTIKTTLTEKEIESISCPPGEHSEPVMGRCIKGMSASLQGCPCLLEVEVQVSGAG